MMHAGERFARAVAGKDAAGLCSVLADPVDFQALTPGRHWQGSRPGQVARDIILGQWFGAEDDIVALCAVATGQVAGRDHVAYRVRVRRAGHDYLVEQQAYYRTDGPRITWMRLLCSGYQPSRP